MSVRIITSSHVCCDHVLDDGSRCHAHIVATTQLPPEAARRAAVERGWRCDSGGDRCPSHLAAGGAS